MKLKTLFFIVLYSLTSLYFSQDLNKIWESANKNFNQNNYDKSIVFCDSLLEFENQLDNQTLAQIHLLKAQNLQEQRNYKSALNSIHEARSKKISDSKVSKYIYLTEGDISLSLKKYNLATTAFKQALDLSSSETEKASILDDLSFAYTKLKKDKTAINYTLNSIDIYKKLNKNKNIITNYIALSKLYSNYGNYSESLKTLNKTIELSKQNNNYKLAQIEDLKTLVEKNKDNNEEAITEFDKDKEIETLELIEDITIEKAKSIEEIEKLSSKMQLVEYRIKAQADEYEKKILNEKLKTLQKEKELEISEAKVAKTNAELETKEAKLKEEQALSEKRRVLIFGSMIVIALATFTIIVLIRLFRNKQKSNIALTSKNALIEQQKSDIKHKADQIHDSIQYARKIQQAILPNIHAFKRIFSKSFIYLNPKEKVSGDFYWHYENEQHKYLAAIDCTGHGVPGAFMTIICNQIFKEIIEKDKNLLPSQILESASLKLAEAFKQYSTELGIKVKDGMDLSLIRIDKQNKKLTHSGARNPLYIVRQKELIEIKGTRKSVSADNAELNKIEFKDTVFSLLPNDLIYLFSDGFADQKGEANNKKYYYKNFRNKLINISEQPLDKQRDELNAEFINWKGNYEQLDDVLVIGIDPLA